MSFKANRQRCGLPSVMILFILQFGCLWSSLTSHPRLPSSLAASTLWKGDKPKRYRLGFITLHHNCNFLSVLKNFRYTTQAAKWWLKLQKKEREFLSHIWTQLIEEKKIHLRLTTMFFLASISQKWKHHIYCDMSSTSFEILQNLSILLCTPLQSLLFWNGPWQTPLDLVHTQIPLHCCSLYT